MNEIEKLTARLEAIGRGPRTTESRRELEAALHSKWESVQVVAGRMLAEWGGDASVSAIRDWFVRSADKEAGWGITGEAAKALARCFDPNDAPWLLDLYFDRAGSYAPHLLLPLVASLPSAQVAARVEAEARSGDRHTRFAALDLAARTEFPAKPALLRKLEGDPDKTIRTRAKHEMRRLTRR